MFALDETSKKKPRNSVGGDASRPRASRWKCIFSTPVLLFLAILHGWCGDHLRDWRRLLLGSGDWICISVVKSEERERFMLALNNIISSLGRGSFRARARSKCYYYYSNVNFTRVVYVKWPAPSELECKYFAQTTSCYKCCLTAWEGDTNNKLTQFEEWI